jgi:hypothetical protein
MDPTANNYPLALQRSKECKVPTRIQDSHLSMCCSCLCALLSTQTLLSATECENSVILHVAGEGCNPDISLFPLLPPHKTDGKTTSVLENTETHGMTARVEGFRVRSALE